MQWRHQWAQIATRTGAWVGLALLATSSAYALDHALMAIPLIEHAQRDGVAASISTIATLPSLAEPTGRRWIGLSVTDARGAKIAYECLVRADVFKPDVVDVPVQDMPELDRLILDLPCSEIQSATVSRPT